MIRALAALVAAASLCACSTSPTVHPAPSPSHVPRVFVAIDTPEGKACLDDCRAERAQCMKGGHGPVQCDESSNTCKLECPDACLSNDRQCLAAQDAAIAERKRPKTAEQCIAVEERRLDKCMARIRKYRKRAAVGVGFGGDPMQMEIETDRRISECRFDYARASDKCRVVFSQPQAPPSVAPTSL